jgi:hypothetical protein
MDNQFSEGSLVYLLLFIILGSIGVALILPILRGVSYLLGRTCGLAVRLAMAAGRLFKGEVKA